MTGLLRLLTAVIRRIAFGPLDRDLSQELTYARMYGELTQSFIKAGDASNVYILARRAFHYADLYRENP